MIWLSVNAAFAETILDCSVAAYKLDKSLFGLKQRVSEKFIGIDSNWRTFCKHGEMTFEGSTVVCTETFKSYLRLNPKQIVARVQKFRCPENSAHPNQPKFIFERNNPDILSFAYIAAEGDPNTHFRNNKCEYYGPIIDVISVQKKHNSTDWKTVEFPQTYPFIGFSKGYSQNEEVYERLVFGDIDKNYTKKSGSIHKTYIDFGLGEYNSVSWQIDPDTGERTSKQDTKYNRRCKKIEN